MTLFWDQTGPLIVYKGETLYVDDLNPEISTIFRMSRKEMLMFGLRCIAAALGGH